MQLIERIKKIEEKMNLKTSGSEFCGCWQKHMQSYLQEAYGIAESEINHLKIYPTPDFEKPLCDMCKKAFSKSDIELVKNLVKIYGQMSDAEISKDD